MMMNKAPAAVICYFLHGLLQLWYDGVMKSRPQLFCAIALCRTAVTAAHPQRRYDYRDQRKS